MAATPQLLIRLQNQQSFVLLPRFFLFVEWNQNGPVLSRPSLTYGYFSVFLLQPSKRRVTDGQLHNSRISVDDHQTRPGGAATMFSLQKPWVTPLSRMGSFSYSQQRKKKWFWTSFYTEAKCDTRKRHHRAELFFIWSYLSVPFDTVRLRGKKKKETLAPGWCKFTVQRRTKIAPGFWLHQVITTLLLCPSLSAEVEEYSNQQKMADERLHTKSLCSHCYLWNQ